VLHDAIASKTDTETVIHRLHMDVAGVLVDGIIQNGVDNADDRVLVCCNVNLCGCLLQCGKCFQYRCLGGYGRFEIFAE